MLILAIDQSTARASMALLRGHTLLASEAWEQTRRGGASVVTVLPELLRRAGLDAEAIERYAVGLGPGAFSSLRVSLSAAVGLALPGNRPVVGVASAEAIAWDLWKETGLSPVTIVGDARRNRLWLVRFEARNNRLGVARPYRLVAADDVPASLRDSALTASPDWGRLAPVLTTAAQTGAAVTPEDRYPRAETVGRLAAQADERDARGGGSTPSPIYVHPPVFVEPRFPGRGEV